MPTFTPNINLKKPLQSENYNIDDFNGNADILDTKIKELDSKIGTGGLFVLDIDGNITTGTGGGGGGGGGTGADGVGVKTAIININGHLIITLTDNTIIDAGLAKGANGSKWYNGSGVPNISLGMDGDYYLNTENSDIYNKISSSWGSPILNIKGASGSGTGDMLKATYDTNNNGKVDQLDDNSAIDTVIGNRTADPTTATTYSLTGTITQWLSWITKRFEQVTGYIWGAVLPCTIKSLYEQADIGTLFIPAGLLYSPITRAGRNKTYNKMFVDCHGENPTSLVITFHHNGSLIYTSPAITTDSTEITVSLPITADQKIQVFTSNTTGLTKGISVSLKQVNRA